jgi:aminopeptidase
MTFVPNIPTEEVFTMPDRTRIDGVVYSSKPLSYNGVIIDKFNITFKNGKAVAFHAEQGEDKLAEIINFDENSCSLGEAALVPFDSPISKQNIVYQSSLFDENASCHLALGASYKENIEGGETMTDEQVFSKGGNQSKVHVDFMIGTADTSIDGIREDGAIIPIFRNGNFVF